MRGKSTKTAEYAIKEVMQIGDLARLAGVSVRAIRYYEELGLIQPESHSCGGFRLYGAENFKRLQVIASMKEVGLTLDEIRRIFLAKKTMGGERRTAQYLSKILGEQLAQVEFKIAALNSIRSELRRSLAILHSCESCGQKVLLDAVCCSDCAHLVPRENVPDTFQVILQ